METIDAIYWKISSRAAIHGLSRERSNRLSYDRGDNPHSDIATGRAAIVMGVGHYTDALTAAPLGRSAKPATNGRSGGSLDRASNSSIAHPVSRASVNV
jgi:hypothetical protein